MPTIEPEKLTPDTMLGQVTPEQAKEFNDAMADLARYGSGTKATPADVERLERIKRDRLRAERIRMIGIENVRLEEAEAEAAKGLAAMNKKLAKEAQKGNYIGTVDAVMNDGKSVKVSIFGQMGYTPGPDIPAAPPPAPKEPPDRFKLIDFD